MKEPPLPDKVTAVHDALSRARIPHAFGGALALAYYAEPRATIDIDLNLFVSAEKHPQVAALLEPLGVDAAADQEKLERDGQGRFWWGQTPIDLFYAYDELHEEMAEAVRLVPFGEERIPILGPEHLIVCKAAFDRAKDWLDIDQVVATADDLDVAAVERDLMRVLGAGDERVSRFRELALRWAS